MRPTSLWGPNTPYPQCKNERSLTSLSSQNLGSLNGEIGFDMASTQLVPVKEFYQEPTAHQIPSQSYFVGLRGFIVLQSFLWTFLNTLVPTAVTGSPNSDGPVYQQILRKVLSVLFWNESLIYSAFILLSARTICTPCMLLPLTKLLIRNASFCSPHVPQCQSLKSSLDIQLLNLSCSP